MCSECKSSFGCTCKQWEATYEQYGYLSRARRYLSGESDVDPSDPRGLAGLRQGVRDPEVAKRLEREREIKARW